MAKSGAPDHSSRAALFTDLYELTMAQAFDSEGMNAPAIFEVFFRRMPAERNYFIVAGIQDVIDFLEDFSVTDGDVEWLARQGTFSGRFLERFRTLRFTGNVHAMREGTPVFPNEPLLRIEAPIAEAQVVETFVLNQIHFQTILATKAARLRLAAGEAALMDFGSRRAHGTDAALKAARVSYLCGFNGTSNLLAGKIYDIPVLGTMAHSYIQAHDDESAALRRFAEEFPETTLLVDTYDTLAGVEHTIQLACELGDDLRVQAIRLDSGDLADLSRQARRMLDDAGLKHVKIVASGGLDEHAIAHLVEQDAPIDGFGVGTSLAVSGDVPSIDMAYKLTAYDGKPRFKLSEGKATLPGAKQVFRRTNNNQFAGDTISLANESCNGEALLQAVMQEGRRCSPPIPLEETRQYFLEQVRQLSPEIRALEPAPRPYPVDPSDRLMCLERALRGKLR